MNNEYQCFCGGLFQSATIAMTIGGVELPVPGYRCDTCSEEVLDAEVSASLAAATTPPLVSRMATAAMAPVSRGTFIPGWTELNNSSIARSFWTKTEYHAVASTVSAIS